MALENLDKRNPEALHDIVQDKGQKVGPNFINPGTADSALVSYTELTSSVIRGNGSEVLRRNITK